MRNRVIATLGTVIALLAVNTSPAQAFTGQNLKNSSYSEWKLNAYDSTYGKAVLNGGASTAGLGFNDVDEFYVLPGQVAISPWKYQYGPGTHKMTTPNGTTLTLRVITKLVAA